MSFASYHRLPKKFVICCLFNRMDGANLLAIKKTGIKL